MFKLISLYKNKTDIICKFDGEVAKRLGELKPSQQFTLF